MSPLGAMSLNCVINSAFMLAIVPTLILGKQVTYMVLPVHQYGAPVSFFEILIWHDSPLLVQDESIFIRFLNRVMLKSQRERGCRKT